MSDDEQPLHPFHAGEQETQRRLRVNGSARILTVAGEWREQWPAAERAVEVAVAQVYWNCSKRIPPRP